MEKQEHSCKKPDFFVQSTSGAFLRSCLSCGFVENPEFSREYQRVNAPQDWQSAMTRPLSWPPGVNYSDSGRSTSEHVYSYCLNSQTSLQSGRQMDRNPYVYCDLPKTSCIRMLELFPGFRLDTLSGRLFEVHWEQDGCPSYSALSYTWADDKGDTSLTNLIFLDTEQKVLRITRNCDRALRSLRQRHKSILLWVDSLCINQSSLSERSHQVALMKTIYSRAATVHAYVGEEQCGEDISGTEAMTLLKDIQQNGFSERLASSETGSIAVLNNFFSRSYFARLWIVQELLLARSITVHCGQASISVSNQSLSLLYEQAVKIPLWVRYVGNEQPTTARSPMDLKDLLVAASVCKVTDLRDKVFGLLGLVGDAQASDLSPDYELMIREVYIGVAAYLFEHCQCCHLIQYVNNHNLNRKRFYGIPSWVPVWDAYTPVHGFEDLVGHTRHIELAFKKLPPDQSPVSCFEVRTIGGWPHDDNSACKGRGRPCKTVCSGSGFLESSIETVFRIRENSSTITIQSGPTTALGGDNYGTAFWDLKGNIRIGIRSFEEVLVRPQRHMDLIRVEGCRSLFLASQTSDSQEYHLISPCIAAIVCQTKESSFVEVLKFEDLRRFSRFTPLTPTMVQFLARWRNKIFTMARLEPGDREFAASIEAQSCRHSFLDESKIYSSTWRSWEPFLASETWQESESHFKLLRQLPSLDEFWDKAHLLHTCVRDWTIDANGVVRYRLAVLFHSRLDHVRWAVSRCLAQSQNLAKTFEMATGISFTIESYGLLEQLDDALANPGAISIDSNILGYRGTIGGLAEAIATLSWNIERTGLRGTSQMPAVYIEGD
ncbi:heterokaryon incompatibility protein het-6 [Fusarium pseudoanthophilum]|uniref:Heterokaryon incompatibility protein het-6 n=1 Tax=Fusarium pseudoanthophilum TaxID=48495 RepID=A0A8H5PN31_9HYPO|nr:heterokaryon incompatibility protein het-6 [Fusarium pseudoanthophilum]